MKLRSGELEDNKFFVVNYLLYTDLKVTADLQSSFYAGYCMYTSLLRESEKRKGYVKKHPDYIKAINLYKEAHAAKDQESKSKLKKQASILFQNARDASGFYVRKSAKAGKNNSLEQYAAKLRKESKWIVPQINALTCNELANRAFDASNKSLVNHVKVRFPKSKEFNCLQGKSNSIRLIMDNGSFYICWMGLKIPLVENKKDEYHNLVRSLFINDSSPIKTNTRILILRNSNSIKTNTRILRKISKNEPRFFVQLTIAGNPPKKNRKFGTGAIGVDAGTKKVAYFCEDGNYGTIDLCKSLKDNKKEIRRISRCLNRQIRANNPGCFDEKGKCIKKIKVFSEKYKKNRSKLNELYRKQTKLKSSIQGQSINKLRSMGDVLKVEDVNYSKWKERKKTKEGSKRMFGRSMQKSGVGGFMKKLENKFDKVIKINTYLTKFSQTCPNCKKQEKKTLSDRIHSCECGFEFDRDLTSALLALVTNNNGETWDHEKASKIIENLSK